MVGPGYLSRRSVWATPGSRFCPLAPPGSRIARCRARCPTWPVWERARSAAISVPRGFRSCAGPGPTFGYRRRSRVAAAKSSPPSPGSAVRRSRPRPASVASPCRSLVTSRSCRFCRRCRRHAACVACTWSASASQVVVRRGRCVPMTSLPSYCTHIWPIVTATISAAARAHAQSLPRLELRAGSALGGAASFRSSPPGGRPSGAGRRPARPSCCPCCPRTAPRTDGRAMASACAWTASARAWWFASDSVWGPGAPGFARWFTVSPPPARRPSP